MYFCRRNKNFRQKAWHQEKMAEPYRLRHTVFDVKLLFLLLFHPICHAPQIDWERINPYIVRHRSSCPRGSLRAALIACDGFTAQAVTGQEYHCPAGRSSQSDFLNRFAQMLIALFPVSRRQPVAPSVRKVIYTPYIQLSARSRLTPLYKACGEQFSEFLRKNVAADCKMKLDI